MTPDDICRTTGAPLNNIGGLFYFDPETLAAGKAIGLDGFRFYILGRGGVFGDVHADVVSAGFGYFSPALTKRMWDTAKERCDPAIAATAYMEAAYSFAAKRLTDSPALEAFVSAADKVVDGVDRSALPLFAAYATLPVPTETVAAAYHYVVLLRELRGSVHLAAVAAAGVPSRVVHQVRRPDMAEGFGWAEEADVTDDHRERIRRVDDMTDDAMTQIYSVLDESELVAFAAGVDEIAAAFAS